MDQYLYLGILYYLISVYLHRIGTLLHSFIYISRICLSSFLAPLLGTNKSSVTFASDLQNAYQDFYPIVGEKAVF